MNSSSFSSLMRAGSIRKFFSGLSPFPLLRCSKSCLVELHIIKIPLDECWPSPSPFSSSICSSHLLVLAKRFFFQITHHPCCPLGWSTQKWTGSCGSGWIIIKFQVALFVLDPAANEFPGRLSFFGILLCWLTVTLQSTRTFHVNCYEVRFHSLCR